MAHYAAHPTPTKLERFIGDYFTHWLQDARQTERQRMKQSQEDIDTFQPLGRDGVASEEAFLQWCDFLDQMNEDDERDSLGADNG